MTAFRLTLLGLGVALLGYLVVEVGPETLLASFRALSWGFLLIVWFPFALITLLDTLGWRYAFRRDLTSFPRLVAVRLAGEAFNATTPTAMGGEPVKAYLLRPQVPLGEGVASVIVAKTTLAVAQGLFLVVGIALALTTLPAPTPPLLQGMMWLAAGGAVALAVSIFAQQKGVLVGGLTFLRWLGLYWGDHRREELRRLDTALSAFYREHRGRLALSILFHFLGWVVGSVEVYLILHLTGISVSVVTALIIEAFITAIRSAAFLIPAGLGVLEGGSMAVFAAFGLGAGVGLSMTLVRRARELTWVAVGLVALSLYRATRVGLERP